MRLKIKVISDLHIECDTFIYENHGEDVVVIAGDISPNANDFIKLKKQINVPLVAVMGNHEFYGHEYYSQLTNLQEAGYLENSTIKIGDVNFICGTGWTNFAIYDNSYMAKIVSAQSINDFKKIRIRDSGRYRKIIPSDMQLLNFAWKNFLVQSFDPTARKNVVVSHFLPLKNSISSRFTNNLINAYFASDCSQFVEKADLWIHGHTHDSQDYYFKNTRVVCNPKGYKKENKNFNKQFMVEI